MSCYMRHMDWLLEALDLEIDRDNRRRVDKALRPAMGMPPDAQCNHLWLAIKALADDERAALPERVRAEL